MLALILGLGESGLAMARWLAREGWSLRVADTRAAPPMLDQLRAELPQAEWVGGAFRVELLEGAQLLALSPGLSPTHSAAAALVTAAADRDVEVVGEIELFARALQRLRAERDYRPRIVGVTGTNGKTTTTRLAGLLMQRAGVRVAVAGNISPTALDALTQRLQADDLPQVWVLELSSFQLATTRSLECDVATVLNITQDHLDWHGSLEAYIAAKARIFGARTLRVLNRDDPRVMALQWQPGKPAAKSRPAKAARSAAAAGTAAGVVALAHGEEPIDATRPVHPADHVERASRRERDLPPPLSTFGAAAPSQPDEYGLVRDGGLMWLAYAEDMSLGHRRRRAAAELPGIEGQVHVHRLMPTEALRVRGRHNAMNALAALALARACDCALAPMLHALRHYEGEPHRVQHVTTIDGVHFFDDSKGTNVGATVAALEGLGQEGRRLVVILGGDGKGQDFRPLLAPLAQFARAVVLIGRDGPRIGELLTGARYPVQAADTLPAAVAAAAQLAASGDAVLLSPACASLDMFDNYKQRAEVFVQAVHERARARGQVL